MSKKFALVALAAVLAVGMVGCTDEGLTAPDGSVYLEFESGSPKIYRYFTVHTPYSGSYEQRVGFGEGGTVFPNDSIEVHAKLHGRGRVGIEKPLRASVYFQFEDKTIYRNSAMRYGPFTGVIDMHPRFALRDGLLQAAKDKPGQRILYVLEFTNGQTFDIFGFYIQQ